MASMHATLHGVGPMRAVAPPLGPSRRAAARDAGGSMHGSTCCLAVGAAKHAAGHWTDGQGIGKMAWEGLRPVCRFFWGHPSSSLYPRRRIRCH